VGRKAKRKKARGTEPSICRKRADMGVLCVWGWEMKRERSKALRNREKSEREEKREAREKARERERDWKENEARM